MKYRKLSKEIEADETNDTYEGSEKKIKTNRQKNRHEDTYEICITYVKIINFKIGFIKMYEFGNVLCE